MVWQNVSTQFRTSNDYVILQGKERIVRPLNKLMLVPKIGMGDTVEYRKVRDNFLHVTQQNNSITLKEWVPLHRWCRNDQVKSLPKKKKIRLHNVIHDIYRTDACLVQEFKKVGNIMIPVNSDESKGQATRLCRLRICQYPNIVDGHSLSPILGRVWHDLSP